MRKPLSRPGRDQPHRTIASLLPDEMARTLRRLIRRMRWRIVVCGVLAVAATAIGALLLSMGIDAGLTLFSPWARWCLSLSALCATAFSAVWFLFRPLTRSFGFAWTARVIEARHPELQERISSAIELLASPDAPELRGSEQLIAALVQEATGDARAIRPRTEITLDAARPYLAAAGATVAVLGALFLAWPEQTAFLLTRATAPFMNLPNVHARDLNVVPGDTLLVEGERLQVDVSIAGRSVRGARYCLTLADGSESSERMASLASTDGAGRRFSFSGPPVTTSFRYRIRAGDAVSRFYAVTVVPPPCIERLDVRHDYPAYTAWEPREEKGVDGSVRALDGTLVTITAHTNVALTAAQFLLNGRPHPDVSCVLPADTAEPGCSFTFRLSDASCGLWSLRMSRECGPPYVSPEYSVERVVDAAPEVTIDDPEERRLRLAPDAQLPISYAMSDDIGLASADLLVDVPGRDGIRVELPLGGRLPPPATWSATWVLDIASLDVRGAGRFVFRLRAGDALPVEADGPQYGFSEPFEVVLDIRAPSHEQAQLAEQEKRIGEALAQARHDLQEAQRQAETLRDDLNRRDRPAEDVAARADQMRRNLRDAQDAAERAAREAERGAFSEQAEAMEELAREEIAEAQEAAGQMKLTDEAGEQATLAEQAARKAAEARETAESLLEAFQKAADAAREAIALREMARKEEKLTAEKLRAERAEADGEPAGENEQEDAATRTPEQWQKDQERLADRLAEARAASPEAEAAMNEVERAAAEELARQARQLEAEQRELARDSERLEKMQQVDREAADLAAAQEKLAEEAAAGEQTREHADPMAEAARDLRANDFPEAVKNQAEARQGLEEEARQLAQAQQEQGQEGEAAAEPRGAEAAPRPQAAEGAEAETNAAAQDETGREQAQAARAPEQGAGKPPAEAPRPDGAAAEAGAPQAPQQAQTPAQAAADLARRQEELRQRTEALMAAREQLGQEHRDAQMERLRQQQGEMAREAEELAEELREAEAQQDNLEQQAAQASAQAAAELQQDRLRPAATAAARAGRQLDELGQRLREEASRPFLPEPPPGQEAAGEQAAEGQAPPMGGEPPPEGGQPGGPAPAGQQAADAGAPAPGVPAKQPGASPGQEPGAPAPGQQGAPPGVGQQTAQLAQMSQRAQDLANRQQHLARAMSALAGPQPAAPLGAQQEALAERVQSLAQSGNALAQSVQRGAPTGPAAQSAANAAQSLAQAQKAAEQAGQELGRLAGDTPAGQPAPEGAGQGQPQPEGQPGAPPGPGPGQQQAQRPSPGAAPSASASQQSAARALAEAAEALEALGAQQQQQAQSSGQKSGKPSPAPGEKPGQPSSSPGDKPGQMAQAQQAADRAAQTQSGMDAAQASGRLSDLAQQAAARARELGVQLPDPSQNQRPGESEDPRRGTNMQASDLSQAKLKELNIRLEDWARLPGELRDQILQAARNPGPREYRELTKRYFQQISRRGTGGGE